MMFSNPPAENTMPSQEQDKSISSGNQAKMPSWFMNKQQTNSQEAEINNNFDLLSFNNTQNNTNQ